MSDRETLDEGTPRIEGPAEPAVYPSRAVTGNKRSILRDEQKIRRNSRNLVTDTRRDNYQKARFDAYEIGVESRRLDPDLAEAQRSYDSRSNARRAKGQAKVQHRNRLSTRQAYTSSKRVYRERTREERLNRKAEKLAKKSDRKFGGSGNA